MSGLLSGLGILLAGQAHAEAPAETLYDLGVHGTEDLRVRYYHLPDRLKNFEDRDILDYVEVVNRLDVSGGTGAFALNARVDAVGLFANRYILDGVLVHERDLLAPGLDSPFADAYLGLEKLNLEWRTRPLTLTVGDAYVSFGRGMALNLVKNTDIDVDTSVRGVKGEIHAGNWDITLASGLTNPQQVALEYANVAIEPNLSHAVTGLRVDGYGLGAVNLGAHGVIYNYARQYDALASGWSSYGQPVDAVVAGASVEALGVRGLDWFAEGDWFQYQASEIPAKNGHALYGSVSGYPGKASVLVELRRNFNSEQVNTFASGYELGSGPTLEYERVITEDSTAAVNSNDITGGRVRVDLRLGSKPKKVTFVPYGSLAAFRDADLGGLHFNTTPETIVHPTVGVQYMKHELHVLINAGQRLDFRDPAADGASLGFDAMTHADVDLSLPLGGGLSLEITSAGMRYHWGVNPQQQTDYTDLSTALALKVGQPWAFIAYGDYSDNPLISSTGNLAEPLYGAVEVQWKPRSDTTVKAFYGAYRAGIRCAGGQCRALPGFEGAKLSVTTTF